MKNDQKLARVVSIDDPDKGGRSKIRIIGDHDDESQVLDKDLPWAVLRQNDPAFNKIGTGGNPLLVGTIVTVRSWDLGKSQQNWIIEGTVPKSGEQTGNVTTNGTTNIDNKKSDAPTAARGEKDTNTVVTNPIKDSKTPPGSKSDDDKGKNIYNEIMKEGAKFKDHATISSLLSITKTNLLDIIKKIDPQNIGGSVKGALDQLLKLKQLDLMTSLSGIQSLVNTSMKQGLKEAIQNTPTINFTKILMDVLEIEKQQEIPDQNIIQILEELLSELGNEASEQIYTQQSDANELETELLLFLKNAHDNWNLSDPNIARQLLIQLYQLLLSYGKSRGEQKAGIDGNASNLASCGNNVQDILTKIASSVLDQSKLQEAMKQFTKSHQILDKKMDIIKDIFKNG